MAFTKRNANASMWGRGEGKGGVAVTRKFEFFSRMIVTKK